MVAEFPALRAVTAGRIATPISAAQPKRQTVMSRAYDVMTVTQSAEFAACRWVRNTAHRLHPLLSDGRIGLRS
jgi:hypothetical protein